MATEFWSGENSRKIVKRIVVEGELVLQTPAHFGNGDGDDLTDMALLVDPFDGKSPLLTGASIAGALRSYLREREHNYGSKEEQKSHSVTLFGGRKSDDEGEQSPLIVDDALGCTTGVEVREGVGINPKSRTAEHDRLFNLELWQAGTTFPLRFELVVRERDMPKGAKLKCALTTALLGLTDGSITLGARKRRGYGQVKVGEWRVTTYDLTTADGLLAWVAADACAMTTPKPPAQTGADIVALVGNGQIGDARKVFTLNATFSLDGSLLIRSGSGQDDKGPDMVHLHARQPNGHKQPVLSGTSLSGALRARALRIANTLDKQEKAQTLVEEMFGKTDRASKVRVSERVVTGGRADLVQNRVSIDRFTGGARDTALFNEQPVFGGDDTLVNVEVDIRNPENYEIGVLLLLLKDLWTGDLPLGGESSVGRGRLKGLHADLTLRNGGDPRSWVIERIGEGHKLTPGEGSEKLNTLEPFVTALNNHLKGVTQ